MVSGEMSSTGAARMAARGALRAGAGLVTLASPRDALVVNAAALTAVMVRAVDGVGSSLPACSTTDDSIRSSSGRVSASAGAPAIRPHRAVGETRAVLDADALTSFEAEPGRLFESIKASHDPPVVLTPHEGSLRGYSAYQQRAPRPLKTSTCATPRACGAVVLLKGPTRWSRHLMAGPHRVQRAGLARDRGFG